MATKLKIGKCKHCGHPEYAWKKRIISTAVASLCKLVKMYDGQPIHLDVFTAKASDRNFNQLKLWGLVETESGGAQKRSSGLWEPTGFGIMFAKGEIRVMEYVVTKQNEIIRFDPPMITVRQALGKKFNYRVLMGMNRQGRRVDLNQRPLNLAVGPCGDGEHGESYYRDEDGSVSYS